MARVKSSASTTKHFSHPHVLELSNSQNLPQGPNATLCSGCKSQPSGDMYVCKPCNFILHSTCANLPQLIIHPSHSNHTLTLLPTPSYPGGTFKCDACNHDGDGFSFHCSVCEFDLHVLCASKPLEITHQLHRCPLQLTFLQNPYKHCQGFSCDVCSMMGSKQWLYRCRACGFDAHQDCATAAARPAPTTQTQVTMQHHNSFPGATLHSQFQAPVGASQGVGYVRPSHYMHSASAGATPKYQNQFQPPMAAGQVHGSVMPNQLMHSASTGSMPPYRPPFALGTFPNNQASKTDSLMSAAVQGVVEGVAQQIGQTLVQSVFGG